ncbi:hypothetical protein OUZ56_005698 [Daphnia magna]|uniref:Uncharacterized protein n=1 Tax=Daphnia magna TaxID=35525 RepID=A0ABQ9YTI8_9CRUS|nr:hypothetical protein OUZ56_005698 [Daphnia magna]
MPEGSRPTVRTPQIAPQIPPAVTELGKTPEQPGSSSPGMEPVPQPRRYNRRPPPHETVPKSTQKACSSASDGFQTTGSHFRFARRQTHVLAPSLN